MDRPPVAVPVYVPPEPIRAYPVVQPVIIEQEPKRTNSDGCLGCLLCFFCLFCLS